MSSISIYTVITSEANLLSHIPLEYINDIRKKIQDWVAACMQIFQAMKILFSLFYGCFIIDHSLENFQLTYFSNIVHVKTFVSSAVHQFLKNTFECHHFSFFLEVRYLCHFMRLFTDIQEIEMLWQSIPRMSRFRYSIFQFDSI